MSDTAQPDAPTAPNGHVREAQLRWNDTAMATSFANAINIQSTREQVDLFFGSNQTWNLGQADTLSIDLSNRIINVAVRGEKALDRADRRAAGIRGALRRARDRPVAKHIDGGSPGQADPSRDGGASRGRRRAGPGAVARPAFLTRRPSAARGWAGRGLVQPLAGPGAQPPTRIAYPVVLDGALAAGAVALDIAAAPGRDPRAVMRQLQWPLAWVRDHRRTAMAAGYQVANERMALALDLLAAALEEDSFAAAARVAVTELAVRLRCERVAFGILHRGRTIVTSVSHTAQFGQQMRLIRQLGDAMDEAVDARAVVLYPPPAEDGLPTRAHAALAAADNTGAVLTIPLLVKDRFVGAMTFERAPGEPFDQATLDLAEATVAILAQR